MPNIPSVLSILLCDSVIMDALSRKKSLIGIFDRITTRAVPIIAKVGFYARLTDLEGEYRFSIRIVLVGGSDEKVVGVLETDPIHHSSRLSALDIALNVPSIPFPEFGRYEFQLFWTDVYLGMATLTVAPMEGQQ